MAGPATVRSRPSGGTVPRLRAEEERPDGAADPSRRAVRPRPLLALGLAVLLAGSVTWLVYGSPWLRVRHLEVSGAVVLTPERVREAAGVSPGGPLASVDTSAVEERIERELPRAASVEVARSWPGTLTLAVTERKPVAVLAEDGRLTEVDAHGVAYATVDEAPEGVPAVRVEPKRTTGAVRFDRARLLREATTVAAGLPEGVRRQTRAVVVRSHDGIVVELAGGRTVRWGSSHDGARKVRALGALMKAAKGAERYDVSAPTAPAVSGS